jgi:hypothetical protein
MQSCLRSYYKLVSPFAIVLVLRFKAVEMFALDTRSLAAMRISVGVLIFIDMAIRLTHLNEHYGHESVMPVGAVVTHTDIRMWSLLFVSSMPAYQALMIIACALAALCFAVGFRTKLANASVWILLVSIHNRMPFISDGGDEFIRIAVLFLLFVPLDGSVSVDRALDMPSSNSSARVLSVGTLCFAGFMCIFYVIAGIAKSGPLWQSHDAVDVALGVLELATPFGLWLRQFTCNIATLFSIPR